MGPMVFKLVTPTSVSDDIESAFTIYLEDGEMMFYMEGERTFAIDIRRGDGSEKEVIEMQGDTSYYYGIEIPINVIDITAMYGRIIWDEDCNKLLNYRYERDKVKISFYVGGRGMTSKIFLSLFAARRCDTKIIINY